MCEGTFFGGSRRISSRAKDVLGVIQDELHHRLLNPNLQEGLVTVTRRHLDLL